MLSRYFVETLKGQKEDHVEYILDEWFLDHLVEFLPFDGFSSITDKVLPKVAEQ